MIYQLEPPGIFWVAVVIGILSFSAVMVAYAVQVMRGRL